jgi:hypothetical protein
VKARVFAQALGDPTPAAIHWEQCPALEEGQKGDAMGRPRFESSLLGAPGATFFCGRRGRSRKREKKEVYR